MTEEGYFSEVLSPASREEKPFKPSDSLKEEIGSLTRLESKAVESRENRKIRHKLTLKRERKSLGDEIEIPSMIGKKSVIIRSAKEQKALLRIQEEIEEQSDHNKNYLSSSSRQKGLIFEGAEFEEEQKEAA